MENKFIQNIENRSIKITKVSIIGIITNIILAIVKIVLGTMTGSVAIISDAINNITDSSSSIITIIGTKLSEKAPDKEHPFGHGRTEYLTSLVIGTIILITGFQMFISSVESLGKKAEYNYSLTVIIIMILSIVSKIFLGIYTENKGKKLGSEALVGSGKDAKNDAFVTTFTLISALFYIFTKISIDAIASAFIALFVIKAGYDLLKETIKKILGEKADADIAEAIYKIVENNPIVLGSHDLILNNYGPKTLIGSINLDIDHEKTVGEIYPIFHHLQLEVYEKLKVFLVFGIYSMDDHSKMAKEVWSVLRRFEEDEVYVLGYHGVVVDEERKEIYCDILIDFVADRNKLRKKLENILLDKFPKYDPHVTIDLEFA